MTLYYLWVKCPQIWSWKDCTSKNYRILFSFRPSWFCTIQKPFETMGRQMRTRNFTVRNDVVERGSVTKSQKGKEAYVERKVRECFQWKAHGQCSKGDSCSFSHDRLAQGDLCGGQRRNGDRPLPHQILFDRRFERLISRVHHANDFRQHCHVGNTPQHCRLGLFQDSDFAGDLEDSKWTSGWES